MLFNLKLIITIIIKGIITKNKIVNLKYRKCLTLLYNSICFMLFITLINSISILILSSLNQTNYLLILINSHPTLYIKVTPLELITTLMRKLIIWIIIIQKIIIKLIIRRKVIRLISNKYPFLYVDCFVCLLLFIYMLSILL